MKVSYDTRPEDVQKAAKYLGRTGTRISKTNRVALGTIVAVIVVGFAFEFGVTQFAPKLNQSSSPGVTILHLAPPVLIGCGLVTWILYWRRNYIRSIEKSGTRESLTRHMTAEITDEGLLIDSGRSWTVLRWSGMDSIGEDADYVHFCVSDVQTSPVPKRAFGTPGDLEAFKREATRRMIAAGGGRGELFR